MELDNKKKTGIVLLIMGSPNSKNDIRQFLSDLFNDPEIINFPRILKPVQRILAYSIAKIRYKTVHKYYDQIGYGILFKNTKEAGDKLEDIFRSMNLNVVTVVATRYSSPSSSDAIALLKEHEVEQIILFPQYPHYTRSTSQTSINDFIKNLEQIDYPIFSIREIKDWSLEPGYINWWVNQLKIQIEKMKSSNDKIHVLFSAHSLPTSHIKRGERYPDMIEKTVEAINKQLKDYDFYHYLSYQSKAGPASWLKPYTDEKVRELGELNVKSLIVVPLGFVTDHLETLHELDIELKEIARSVGIRDFIRIDTPNADDEYLSSIADMLSQMM